MKNVVQFHKTWNVRVVKVYKSAASLTTANNGVTVYRWLADDLLLFQEDQV